MCLTQSNFFVYEDILTFIYYIQKVKMYGQYLIHKLTDTDLQNKTAEVRRRKRKRRRKGRRSRGRI